MTKIEGEQLSLFDQDTWSGKTYQEHSQATEGKTSKRFSRKPSGSQTRMPLMCLCLRKNGATADASTMKWGGGALLGEYTMRSFGEYPREENASALSQILEDSAHQKYYLSAKACQGILRRAEKRGKELPARLKAALERQAQSNMKEWVRYETSPTLRAGTTPTVMCLNDQGGAVLVENHPADSRVKINEDGVCQSLTSRMGTGEGNVPLCMDVGFFTTYEDSTGTQLARQYKDPPIVATDYVRRLTPMECERLQGYPDGWTDIGKWVDSKGKKHKDSDAPRYKALGNSIALPFWFYILRRMAAQYERPATLGSLFDGIGGFPLCWERCNGEGTAIWASEIDEFCIAVTKKHFPEEKQND